MRVCACLTRARAIFRKRVHRAKRGKSDVTRSVKGTYSEDVRRCVAETSSPCIDVYARSKERQTRYRVWRSLVLLAKVTHVIYSNIRVIYFSLFRIIKNIEVIKNN